MKQNKRGIVNQLTAVGWGLVTFAIILGLGLTVLTKFGTAVGAGTANTTIDYIMTQLGSTGLAGWIPVIIVIVIAGIVLLVFGGKNKY